LRTARSRKPAKLAKQPQKTEAAGIGSDEYESVSFGDGEAVRL
jgi:hypothetical protein